MDQIENLFMLITNRFNKADDLLSKAIGIGITQEGHKMLEDARTKIIATMNSLDKLGFTLISDETKRNKYGDIRAKLLIQATRITLLLDSNMNHNEAVEEIVGINHEPKEVSTNMMEGNNIADDDVICLGPLIQPVIEISDDEEILGV